MALYFLVDKSGSMDSVETPTRWEMVTQSLSEFASDAAQAATPMGIAFFPNAPADAPLTCFASADCGQYGPCVPLTTVIGTCAGADSCLPGNHDPMVPLSLDHQAIVTSLAASMPGGATPTRPAVEASKTYLETWAIQNAGIDAALVLITDGEPTGCTANTASDVAGVAKSLLEGPSGTRTYVITVGTDITSGDLIARAGGTEAAIPTSSPDQVSAALAEVQSKSNGCAP